MNNRKFAAGGPGTGVAKEGQLKLSVCCKSFDFFSARLSKAWQRVGLLRVSSGAVGRTEEPRPARLGSALWANSSFTRSPLPIRHAWYLSQMGKPRRAVPKLNAHMCMDVIICKYIYIYIYDI